MYFRSVGCSLLVVATLTGCASYPDWLASAGPSREQVVEAQVSSPIRLIEIDETTARRVLESEKREFFSRAFPDGSVPGYTVGPGDILEVSIWEAPPAILFGAAVLDPRAGMTMARASAFPEQMVAVDGSIKVPFAGSIPVAGKSPQQIEAEIVRRLTGKANQPQVIVRVTRNVTSNVTVVGEVTLSQRVQLTAKGERLLDAIAAAGGVRQPVSKVTVQLTRGPLVQSMPLERVIQTPRENVLLAPGDVVTVLHQPLSFTVLGATGKNEEINFEAQGISLAQALARAGGIQDGRADARGIFVFRFEEPLIVGVAGENPPLTPDGKVPVVYRLDMKNPAAFLVAQGFPVRNKDVVYVANASSADLQKFLNILTSSIYSVSSLVNLGR